MVRFFRWLIGFVQFRFEGGFADGFINDCYMQQLAVRDLHYDGDVLCAECPASQYLRFCRTAKRHGGRLQIVKKRGIVFPFLKLRNRFGLAVGALLFVVILSFLSGFIWEVQVVGNSRITDAELRDFLMQNGVYEGVYWGTVDKDKVENLIMASFDDCAWVHINELGTTARVEINETRKPPARKRKKKGVYNVVAAQDGFIAKITVANGKSAARVGDFVSKGDVLINGVYTDIYGKKHRVHADGEVTAQVTEPFEIVVNRTQSSLAVASEKEYKTLAFFGLYIPLYLGSADLKNADCKTSSDYLKVNEKPVPVGVITLTARRYRNIPQSLTDRELARLAESETAKKLKSDYADCTVISKRLTTEITADSAIVKGQITCVKNIAKEKKE
ncbi:MAG: sporulation protein YqfD [Eubacterium sp.]|nr:sporulation protein YqfD [Eubacterium sp.]